MFGRRFDVVGFVVETSFPASDLCDDDDCNFCLMIVRSASSGFNDVSDDPTPKWRGETGRFALG